jgi:enamine deaminase RidA (YjgF/YER057c/UK114 family)
MLINRIESGARMSQAVVANGFVFLAGQVATDPAANVEGQTRQVLGEIERLLAATGPGAPRRPCGFSSAGDNRACG